MSLSILRFPRTSGRVVRFGIIASFLSAAALAAGAQTTPPAKGLGAVGGIVRDSLRGGVLPGSIVQLVQGGAVKREAVAKENGTYVIDSVPGGVYMLRMLHPSLDTLGMAVTSLEFSLADGQRGHVDLAIPPARKLLPLLCRPEQLLRGPSAIVGMVLDPTTHEPVRGITVQLDNTTTDAFGLTRIPLVRTATTDSLGRYRICGLPEDVDGKIQAERNGIKSGEVDIKIAGNQLALRGISYSLSTRTVAVTNDSGKVVHVLTGAGRLTGKVINDRGLPVDLARVRLLGTLSVATTNTEGVFTLDSLPPGSQTIEIRKLGYGVTERPVEIGEGPTLKPVTLTMDKLANVLPAMVTTADPHTKRMEHFGILERKKKNIGGTIITDAENIRSMTRFTDGLIMIPGISVRRCPGDSQENCIEPITGGYKTCMNYLIDNSPFPIQQQGDLDHYVAAYDVQAVEYYKPAEIPAEFMGRAGETKCSLLVVWTTHSIPAKRGG